jgi:hypothetical protein
MAQLHHYVNGIEASSNTGNIRFLASEKAHERGLYGKGISNPDDLK